MASVTTPTITKIIRLNNYDLLGTKNKKYTMYMCLDTLQLWYDETESKRVLYSYVGVETVNDLQNNIIPELGTTYYCWESNSLWLWMNRWVCIYSDAAFPSAYRTDNGTIDSIYLDNGNPTIVDNNGLLRDGSVVVRDANRIIKGRIYISEDYDNMVISSYLGGGLRLLPNGAFSSDGELYIDDHEKSHIRAEWNVLNHEIYVDYSEKPNTDKNPYQNEQHRYYVWHTGNLDMDSIILDGKEIYDKVIAAQNDGSLPDPLVLNVDRLNGLKATDFALATHIHKAADIVDFREAAKIQIQARLDEILAAMIFNGARITWKEAQNAYELSTDNFKLEFTGGAYGSGIVTHNTNTKIELAVDPDKHLHTDLDARITALEAQGRMDPEDYYTKVEVDNFFSDVPASGKALLVNSDGILPGTADRANSLTHTVAVTLDGDITGTAILDTILDTFNLTTSADNVISETPVAGKALKLDANSNLPTKSYSSMQLDHEIQVKLIGDVTGIAQLDTSGNIMQLTTHLEDNIENAIPRSEIGTTVPNLVNGKVPNTQLPDRVTTSLNLIGSWNGGAAPSANPVERDAYVVTTANTFNGVKYQEGDWIYYYNGVWHRLVTTNVIREVNSKTGDSITLTPDDVGAISKALINHQLGTAVPKGNIVRADEVGRISSATVDKLTREVEITTDENGDIEVNTASLVKKTAGNVDYNLKLTLTDTGYENIADRLRRDIYDDGTLREFRKKLNITGNGVTFTDNRTADMLTLDIDNRAYDLIYFSGTMTPEFSEKLNSHLENMSDKPFMVWYYNNGSVQFVPFSEKTGTYDKDNPLIVASDEYTPTTVNGKLIYKTSSLKTTVDQDFNVSNVEIIQGTKDLDIDGNPKSNKLTNQNLNTIKTQGFYEAVVNNTTTNKPKADMNSYGMLVYMTAEGNMAQEITGGTDKYTNIKYIRQCINGVWTDWQQIGIEYDIATNTKIGLVLSTEPSTTDPESTLGTVKVDSTTGKMTVNGLDTLEYLPLKGSVKNVSGSIKADVKNDMYGPILFNLAATDEFSVNAGVKLGGRMASSDAWRIYAGSPSANNGYLEIATADDGTEPIYIRQYGTGSAATFFGIDKESDPSQVTHEAVILDENGNSGLPLRLRVGQERDGSMIVIGGHNKGIVSAGRSFAWIDNRIPARNSTSAAKTSIHLHDDGVVSMINSKLAFEDPKAADITTTSSKYPAMMNYNKTLNCFEFVFDETINYVP